MFVQGVISQQASQQGLTWDEGLKQILQDVQPELAVALVMPACPVYRRAMVWDYGPLVKKGYKGQGHRFGCVGK